MCQIALNLAEPVLPLVPLRQWAFTLPHPLRVRLAYDAALLGAVARPFVDSILGWYQRHLRTSARTRADRRGRRSAARFIRLEAQPASARGLPRPREGHP